MPRNDNKELLKSRLDVALKKTREMQCNAR